MEEKRQTVSCAHLTWLPSLASDPHPLTILIFAVLVHPDWQSLAMGQRERYERRDEVRKEREW